LCHLGQRARSWSGVPVPARSSRARAATLSSCSSVLEENLFDICKSEFPCPGQGSRSRFVIGQVGRGTALEQELHHPSPALGQLGLLAAEPGANGGGQGRLVEFDAAGVDVGAGFQKDGRDGPVSACGAGVQKRLAEPVRPVGVESPSQQPADQCGRPPTGQVIQGKCNALPSLRPSGVSLFADWRQKWAQSSAAERGWLGYNASIGSRGEPPCRN
jgi:hypothetical protein